MIDNGHALLVPTSIFAIMLIYYLIRKFYKSNKKNKNMDSLKSSNMGDKKFKQTLSEDVQIKNKENYTNDSNIKSNNINPSDSNTQNDELEKRKRDAQLGGFYISVFLVIVAHLMFLPLLLLILIIPYGLITDIPGLVETFIMLFDNYINLMNYFTPNSGFGKFVFVGVSFVCIMWLLETYVNIYRYFRGYMSWNELLNGERWWTFLSETKQNNKK